MRSFSNTGDTVVSLTVPLSWGTRFVRLGLEPSGRIPLVRGFELDRWFLVDGDTSTFLRPIMAEDFLKEPTSTPPAFVLHPAYPNPFNPTTTIRYELPNDSHVSLKVYNVLGSEVTTLVDGMKTAGYHYAVLNAADLSSGVYFYRLSAGDFSNTKKVLLTR